MALLFKRRHEIQKPDDPGAKVMNRLIMIGLLFFLGMSILNEKRTLEKTKLVWSASVTNHITGVKADTQVVENDGFLLQLSDDEIAKLEKAPRNADGRVTVFTLKLNRVLTKDPVKTKPATHNQPVAASQPAANTAAKTERAIVKEVNKQDNTNQNLPAAQKTATQPEAQKSAEPAKNVTP